MTSSFEIRTATAADVPVILSLIRELADYERAPDAVVTNEAGLREVLFGPQRSAEVLLALEKGEPVGFAVYFYNFSTWLGRPGLYLEDLFVRPTARGKDMAAPCSCGLPASRRSVAADEWNGRCSIGTIRRSSSTRNSARNR